MSWSSNERDIDYVVRLNRPIERLTDAEIDFVVGGFAAARAALAHDPDQVCQRARDDVGKPRRAGLARRNDDHFFAAPRPDVEARIRDRAAFDQCDIDPAIEQKLGDVLRVGADQTQLDVRMLPMEGDQTGGQPVGGDGGTGTDGDLAARQHGVGSDRVPGFAFQREDAATIVVQALPGFVHAEAAPLPVEQDGAELGFQLAHGLRGRRLADVQRLGGARKTTVFDDRRKHPQQIQIHP